ncbi:MAG: hypothetical protein ACPG49_13290 [Chitinophagales bacterium]
MTLFEESNLRFEFGEDWTLIEQYDILADFDRIKNAISGTKGVDFIGILNDKTLYFFEVKNFKGHRISSKGRFSEEEDPVWLEVAQKVRDTVAGIIGASRKSLNEEERVKWQEVSTYLTSLNKKLVVVLWLEQDGDNKQQEYKRKRKKGYKTTIKGKLKESLLWLADEVLVLNCDYNLLKDSLEVSFLPVPPTP